jgi:hypothetical protein
MSTFKNYEIEIKNFDTQSPCLGFFILTGLTNNIDDADYINGTPTLHPINNGFSFNLEITSNNSEVFVFIMHCDNDPLINPNLKKMFQLSMVDLRCNNCYKPCEFGVDVFKNI